CVAINTERDQTADAKKYSAKNDEWEHLRRDHGHGHNGHARFERSVGFGVLNGMSGLVRGDAERRHRWRVEDVAGKAKLLLRRVVMVAKEIVRLDNIDIVDLRRLQNFPCAFRAGNVRGRAHFPPFTEGAANADLRPDADNQGHADVEQPTTSAKADWIEHAGGNLVA